MANDDMLIGLHYMLKAFNGYKCTTKCDNCPLDQNIMFERKNRKLCALLSDISAGIHKEQGTVFTNK